MAEELGADGPGQGREEGSACSLVGGGGGSAVVTCCCPFAPPCPQTACLNSQGFEVEKGGSEERAVTVDRLTEMMGPFDI